MYTSLNDAAQGPEHPLASGSVEIWYQKPQFFGMFGRAAPPTLDVDPTNIEATHIKLGSVRSDDLEEIFGAMQGENWSPQGEARELIRGCGLGHTSMSVGDIVKGPDGRTWMCEMFGWATIDEP